MRSLFCLFCLLWLILPGQAEEAWKHQGSTWKHTNGLSITFPPDFEVAAADDGTLNAKGKQGFVSFTVQGCKGEKLYKSWLSGQQKAFDEEGLKVKNEFDKPYKTGVTAHYREYERLSQQGLAFVVVSAALQQGQDYLCMQIFYPKEREKDWSPLLNGVMTSVKH